MGVYIGQTKYTGGPADASTLAIPKSVGQAAGDLIYFTGASVPVRLPKGTAGQVLTMNSGATAPVWAAPSGGGGGTTVTLPSGYSASTGITLNSSTLTTVANVGGVDLKLKAPAGSGGSSDQNFHYAVATYNPNTPIQYQGYSVYDVTTDPTKRNFVVVALESSHFQQDESPCLRFNYDSTLGDFDLDLLPSAEIYVLYVNNTQMSFPTPHGTAVDPEMLLATGVGGYWVSDPPYQLTNQVNSIGIWSTLPEGSSLFCTTIVKNSNGVPQFSLNTWLGTFDEI